MPKAKAPRSPRKASRKRATGKSKSKSSKPKSGRAKTTVNPRSASKRNAAKSRRKGPAIDPRMIAAIGLALEAEQAASERAAMLAQPLSAWVALGRARAVRTS